VYAKLLFCRATSRDVARRRSAERQKSRGKKAAQIEPVSISAALMPLS
jgi:hypothetical protein